MKRIVSALVALCVLFLISGMAFATGAREYGGRWISGSGIVTTETRVVSDFTGIIVEGSGDVELSQGLIQSVTVECDQNIQQYVKTDVVGGTIHLGFKNNTSIRSMTRMVFHITIPRLQTVVIAGSGNVRIPAPVLADTVSLSIRGSGDIDAVLVVGRLTATIDGSGDIGVSGKSNDLAITINGSGSVRADRLAGVRADVRINGSGNAQVSASETVAIRITGSGDVEYSGGGRATVSSSGSGTARQK